MVRSLYLEEVISQEWRGAGIACPSETEVLVDANGLKYKWKSTGFYVAATWGVMDELSRNPDVFPEETIHELGMLLRLDVITPFISAINEYTILAAASKKPKKRMIMGDIGWVDMEQISHAMDRARNGEKTVIISNDGDVLRTVKYLRGMSSDFKNHMCAISVQRYLERKYDHVLKGIQKPFRDAMIYEIDSQHKLVA